MKLLIFLFILFSILFYYKNTELYTNYKKIVVTPNKYVYNPLLFMYNPSNINNFIYKLISTYIPAIKFKRTNTPWNIMKTINLTKNILGIVSEYDLLYFIENHKNNNLRFICNIFYKYFTILSIKEKSITNLKNKSIGVVKNSPALYVLKRLQTLFKFNLVIINTIEIKNIYRILKSKKLDALALFISHPNKELVQLFKKYTLNMFGTNNVPKSILKTIIPNYKESSIEIIDYIHEQNYMIPTIKIYNMIITNKNTSEQISYLILKNLYHKFSDIKLVKDVFLKRQTNYFNINNIFISNNPKFILHKGVYKYYTDKGYITFIDRNICRKQVGLQKCDLNARLNPYRIL
jgi:hypothetical protein